VGEEQRRSGIDAEGIMVVLRCLGVGFAIVQTLTYYLPFPPGVERWAWVVNILFAAATVLLTVWWYRTRGEPDGSSRRRLGWTALTVDLLFAASVTWVYAFDPDTAIFAIMYIATLEGAFRFGLAGAWGAITFLGVSYAVRDVWAAQHYDLELLPASISFRVGVGCFIAAVAGAMAERYEREHRRLQVALASEREAAAALRSLDELRSTFLAAVSHELRTPLTSILGFSLTIQDRSAELLPETRMMLEQVVEESRHLGQLLEDLLDIERMGRGAVALDRRSVDVAAIAEELALRVGTRVGRDIDVVTDGEHVDATIDASKARRILENLIGNAAKYSPDPSEITVRISRFGGGVLLVVDDEGPGVPEALRRSIFAPFERGHLTSSHQPGTGIGLSLVDRFARVHGGRAWVEERSDGLPGASFRVFLPDGPEGMSFATVMHDPWGEIGDVRRESAAS
jgi:signal transduction histidine kinase